MLIALESPRLVWYLMRGSSLVALMLLTLTVTLGVVGVTRLSSTRWPRLVTGGLHRNLALTATCFIGIHVVTALVDGWVGLGWIGALIPLHSAYRPLWVGLGVVAFDLFLAVLTTSLLRRRIGTRAWRLIHWGTWALWPLALVHALGSGTDTTATWGLAICLACIALVVAALGWRMHFALRLSSRRECAPAGVPHPSGSHHGELRPAPRP